MPYKIENIETETWHRIMTDLQAIGFTVISQYGGMDVGIDYNRYELINPADLERIIIEWDNWYEGEIKALPSRLAALHEKYQLTNPIEYE